MARPDRVFKAAYNAMLDALVANPSIQNISAIARQLDVSRTTARAILKRLEKAGILTQAGPERQLLRVPQRRDYFAASETMDMRDALEATFMQMIRSEDIGPGALLNERLLARQLNVSVQTMREFLIGLSRFGFVRKDHHRRWVLEGVTRKYALELHEVRVMFESRAVEKLCQIPENDPFWGGLIRLKQDHLEISAHSDFADLDFPALDTKFHRFLNAHADNRLIVGFQDAISMIFNHHYLWPLEDQMHHHLTATSDHLQIIQAVLERDHRKARAAMQSHLDATRHRFEEATS
ncbi:FCD domain-containing protein [Ruegeria lacuscaerulensis]|uniref:FCD domain-containing protein n=1 Tax=Ruegeria lacuscaerulensis TaxID=55218 RepID=UPI00147F512D|nr:FCD domain-containing protein [Ruegeria lacuscaerulensis]